MASLSSLGEGKPQVLLAQVLLRGRFCEAIANSAKLRLGESDPFLLGMFSLLDAILGRPLQGILDDLNIGRNIRNALLGIAGDGDLLSLILRIVKSYEVGDWREVDAAAQVIGISPDDLNACYLNSLSWVDTIFAPDEQKGRPNHASVPVGLRRHADAPVAGRKNCRYNVLGVGISTLATSVAFAFLPRMVCGWCC